MNRFSRVASAKFEILFRSKKHSIPLRNAHMKSIATDPNIIKLLKATEMYTFFRHLLILKLFYIFLFVISTPVCNNLVVCKWHYLSFKHFFSYVLCIFKNVGILSIIARYRHFRDLASLHFTTLNILN